MSKNKMKIWEQVCQTNPKHTKHVNQRGGFTAVDAQYQIKRATEVFGSIGLGWGIKNEVFTPMTNGMALYQADFWYECGDEKCVFPINSAITMQRGGRLDDDFAKKVSTDALTKGLSKLGFNSDIFEGRFDDNKYVKEMDTKFNTEFIEDSQKVKIEMLLEEASLSDKEKSDAKGWVSKQPTKSQADLFIESLQKKKSNKASLNNLVKETSVSKEA